MAEQTVTAEALNDLRQRYLNGEPWTRDELKSAIHAMIGNRLAAVQTATPAPKGKAKAQAINLDDMIIPATPAPVAAKPELPAPPVAKPTEPVVAPVAKKPDTGGFF